MQSETSEWPAEAGRLTEARAFLREHGRGRMLVLPDGDVDGLSSGVLMLRALERLGGEPVPLVAARGELLFGERLRERIRAAKPSALVVLDQGARAEPLVPRLPTLVVDHHLPRGSPPGAVFLTAFGHEPVASTALLTYALLRPVVDVSDLVWLAALGTVADLGPDAPFEGLREVLRTYKRTHVTAAAALLNAARRSSAHDVETALAVLLRARDPSDVALGRVEGVERLQQMRAEVVSEVGRCARIAPLFGGMRFALIVLRSPARVHPLIAQRWAGRLRGRIVIAANFGYFPGRVNFSMRTSGGGDLLEALREVGGPLSGETGYGHPQATGGSMPEEDFRALLEAMEFDLASVDERLEKVGLPPAPLWTGERAQPPDDRAGKH